MSAALKPYAWVILGIVFLASVAAPMNQFKVPPVMPALISEFSLSMTQAGLLMSIFSLAGLIVAFPAGAILARLGQRRTCSIALLVLISGSVWGTFATTDLNMVSSRFMEGAGMAMLGVTAPVIITSWFPPARRGLALGVWSAWVSTGVILMMNLSPIVSPAGQWHQTWWLGTAVALLALLVFNLFFREPPGRVDAEGHAELPRLAGMLLEVLARRDVWILSIILFCFNIMVLAMNSFFPTYLGGFHGLTMQEADFYSSIANMVMLLSCPIGGWLVDKTGCRRAITAVCMFGFGVWWWAVFRVELHLIPLFMIVFGLLAGPVITTVITSLPDAAGRPVLLGLGMSLLMFWHHLGEFLGPLYFGKIYDLSGDWVLAGIWMVPVCIVGSMAGLLIKAGISPRGEGIEE